MRSQARPAKPGQNPKIHTHLSPSFLTLIRPFSAVLSDIWLWRVRYISLSCDTSYWVKVQKHNSQHMSSNWIIVTPMSQHLQILSQTCDMQLHTGGLHRHTLIVKDINNRHNNPITYCISTDNLASAQTGMWQPLRKHESRKEREKRKNVNTPTLWESTRNTMYRENILMKEINLT